MLTGADIELGCVVADAHGLMQTKTLKDSSSYGGNAAAGTCAPVLHGALIHTVQDQKHTLRFVPASVVLALRVWS